MRYILTGCLLIAAIHSPVLAQAECGQTSIISPNVFVVENPQPRISWHTVKAASKYLLSIESRVPEGRVLFTNQLYVDANFWVPPVPLAESVAVVKLKVVPLCGEEEPQANAVSAAVTHRFRIDATQACRLSALPIAQIESDTLAVRWSSVLAASEYETTIRSAMDGSSLRSVNGAFPQAQFDGVPAGVWVISVRPRCKKIPGPYRSVVVAVP